MSFDTLKWVGWHDTQYYQDSSMYDVLYKGYVYMGAYPNAGKICQFSSFEEHPLGEIKDKRQSVIGKDVMCRPNIIHPYSDGIDVCNKWITQVEYLKLLSEYRKENPQEEVY